MTVEDIAHKIANPSLCTIADIQEIEKLIEKYPYAQSFPILLLQILGKTKSMNFEEALNQHAFRISDRAHLYQLINSGEQIAETSIETPIIPLETPTPAAEMVAEEIIVPIIPVEEIVPKRIQEIEIKEEVFEISAEREIELIPVEKELAEKEVEIVKEVANTPEIERAEMELTTDNSDFATFEVQEMSFEPVQVYFDDDEINPIDFDEIPETIIPVIISEEPNIEIEEKVTEVAEFEGVEGVVGIESITEIEESEVFPEVSMEEEIPELLTFKNLEELSVEKLELETDTIISEEIIETEFIEPEIHELPVNIETEVPSESEVESEPEVEPIAEDEIEAKGIQPLSFFDPTADLFEERAIESIEIDQTQPSEFDKEISLDIIEKSEVPELDEMTSHALAESYHLTLEENEITEDEQKINSEESSEIVSGFEQKLADEKRSFLDWLKVSATTHSQEYQVKQRANEILDKFIQEDPKITRISKTEAPERKAAEFFKVSKIAKASLSEKEMPVSETLAEIYVAQGSFSKAIECYQQLMLLNPEKKGFFANQIKKLKKNK